MLASTVRRLSRCNTPMMGAGDELVDIVDDTDVVIASVPRRTMRSERLLHRAVFIAVVHSDRHLLVHRRSDHKDLWPGRWDIAVGGVVAAGESYEEAARREAAEEVGIDDVELVLLGTGRYVDDDVALLGRCYRITHDGPFTFADGEVAEARWVTPAELSSLRRDHDLLPDSLALLLPLLPPDFRSA